MYSNRFRFAVFFLLIVVASSWFVLPSIVPAADMPLLKESTFNFGSFIKNENYLPASIVFSPDLKRMSYVVNLGKKYAVGENGKNGPLFDAVAKGTPLFSRNSVHSAYIGQRGDKWMAVLDGVIGSAYEAIVSPIFSYDSSHFAFIAQKKKNHQCVVVDGTEGESFEVVNQLSLHYSADSKRYVYVGIKDKKMAVVVDGKKGGMYDDISIPIFSPDSKHIAYGARKGSKFVIVEDDRETTSSYDRISILTFSADSRKLAYTAQDGKEWFMVIDGKKHKSYDEVGIATFSPDSVHVSYLALDGKKMFMVTDGKKGPVFDDIKVFGFSPDSAHYCYTAQKGKKWYAVYDDKPGPAYDLVSDPTFSPDSKHLNYVAQKGVQFLVVLDGKEGQLYTFLKIPTLFSPDSLHLAYQAMKGGVWMVVVDGKEGLPYVEVTNLVWSPNSEHFAYIAQWINRWLLVVDDRQALQNFGGFFRNSTLNFITPTKIQTLAIQNPPGLNIVRYEVGLQ